MRFISVFFFLLPLNCYAAGLSCVEFVSLPTLKALGPIHGKRKSVRLLTEQAMRPILKEMIIEVKKFNYLRKNARTEIVSSSEVRPSISTIQKSKLKPLEVFDLFFPDTVLVNVGKEDVMIEVGVNDSNKEIVTEVAEVISSFGQYIFFSRPDLIERWESTMATSTIIKNNTFSEGSFNRLFEDISNSVLVTFSLLTSNWGTLNVSSKSLVNSLTGNADAGPSLFDVLAISFGPGYIGPYGSIMHFKKPLYKNSSEQIKLTTETIARVKRSKEIWLELNPQNSSDFTVPIKETGRGCPMVQCSVPGSTTDLTSFVLSVLQHTSLMK